MNKAVATQIVWGSYDTSVKDSKTIRITEKTIKNNTNISAGFAVITI